MGDRDQYVCVYIGIWVSCFCVHNSELISQTARHFTHIGWNNPEAIAETICKEERWRKGMRMHIYAYRMYRCMCITAFLVFLVITMYVAVCVLIPQPANAPLRWKRPNLMKDQLWGTWMVRTESHCPSQRALHSRCQHRKVHLNSKCIHLCYHVAWMVLCVPVGWFTNSPAVSLRLTDILGYSELCSPTVPRQYVPLLHTAQRPVSVVWKDARTERGTQIPSWSSPCAVWSATKSWIAVLKYRKWLRPVFPRCSKILFHLCPERMLIWSSFGLLNVYTCHRSEVPSQHWNHPVYI